MKSSSLVNNIINIKKNHSRLNGTSGWMHLWKIPVIPLVACFCRKLLHSKLPTSQYIAAFGIMDTKPCLLCGAQFDEFSHIFFYCQFSRSVYDIFQHKLDLKFGLFGQWHTGDWLKEGSALGKHSKWNIHL